MMVYVLMYVCMYICTYVLNMPEIISGEKTVCTYVRACACMHTCVLSYKLNVKD